MSVEEVTDCELCREERHQLGCESELNVDRKENRVSIIRVR